MSDYCTECGMPVSEGEFHPYAACLMFVGCKDGNVVRANLAQLAEYKQRAETAEAKLRELALDELTAQAQELDMGYAKPFPAPKQEEK